MKAFPPDCYDVGVEKVQEHPEQLVPMNFRVRESVRHELKLMAVMERKQMTDLLYEALDLLKASRKAKKQG